jgi:acyl-CoA synthetase (AMP-forming)/AMP-acid ligase II
MPMYHGTGGIAAVACLVGGISLAIGKKFSVTNFWKDIHDSESTFFIYVGETARYLLAAPPGPLDKDHKVRCMYGNGLRPDVWNRFRERFNVPEIAEFFNSTEGIFTLINWDRGEYFATCVGHHGLILRTLFHNFYVPVAIDHETGDIWRDPMTGFAKRNSYSEGGEIIVELRKEQEFQGYWNSPAATEKKFVRNVFKKGDLYYRSGDALRRTDDGRWFFMDRLGDTFRWKSENVSTAEVGEVLARYPGVIDANVYGVLVPKHDGRAGCAALLVDPAKKGSFDYNGLLKYARKSLPRYAVPVFIRIVNASSIIHNNKQNKAPLRAEGVDPDAIGTKEESGKNDAFLWLPPRGDEYLEFGRGDWESLKSGEARL